MKNQRANPWEMLENEPSKAWGAFQVYRDLGVNRTLAGTAKVLESRNLKGGGLKTWSAKYNWVERARQFDAFMDAQVVSTQVRDGREEYKEKLKAYRKEVEATSKAMVAMGVKTMQILQKDLNKRLSNPQELMPSELAALMRASMICIESGWDTYTDTLGTEKIINFLNEQEN